MDGNGEPLVVYHQTGNDFTVFDTKHTGAGEFDSEMPTGIFMKPTSDSIGLRGNKQMALYANIRNPLTVNNRAELVRFYEKNIDGYKDARENINDIDSEYEASKKAKSLIDDYFRDSNYDGVIVNNDVGSFGRSTKTYIAFENTQVKSATDNIGTFDGKNPDIRYAIDDTKSSAEKYSEDDFENKVVYPNMDERQRAQILRNERIKLSSYDSKMLLSPDDVASLENSVKRNAFKILRELGTEFNVYKNYTNENIELDFDYSKSGLKESIDKQGNITTNYTDFAKMLTVFDDVIRNAVPIEVHTDKYVGTKRENPDLKYDYVLLSAFTDDNYIVPVELHIKEYKESYRINNKLYVSITLGKIKIEDNIITGSLLKNNNKVANSVPLSSEVSIPELVSEVNEKLGNFYKYLPDELLSETQLKYKKIAAEKDRQRLSTMRNKTIQTENKSDIRYAIDDTKQEEVDFRKALTREEWASFYSSLNKYNQRDNLRIGDNSILIPDDNNAYNYKLVCYRTDKNNIRVKNVYLIENYDYNIHSNEINVLQILSDYEGEEYSEKQARAILQNYTGMYGTLFKRYNSVSRKFVKLTRESVSDRRNIKETADGAGTYENSEREVSGGLSEDKISDIRYANDDTVYEEKYKNLENLDDEEIKVYNKRGWAYGLFNREDMKLLNEKFSELDKRINSRTDNVLADGTRIVEINNKVVLIGGTYKEPEIYSVFEINARHEFDTESIKDDIKYGQIRYGRSRYSFEEFGKYEETCEGKDKVRFYSQTDYLYIRGITEKGLRAVSKGDFSRYGYLEESNNGRRSGENAQGEVSSVLLDEDTSDVRFAIDDTLNDWLDDLPEGIDYEKVVEKNPVVAVAKIYNSASKTAESGLRQSQNVRLGKRIILELPVKLWISTALRENIILIISKNLQNSLRALLST